MSIESNNTPVDPRIQIELEKLNTATDNINKYEVELDEAKCEFKKLLAESVEKIKQSAHKLGNSIEAAKPYYEARLYANQLAKEAQTAAVNHEKAKSVHAAAKEMVYLAEQGLGEKSTLDTACQEMLSHAASKVNQSQVECTETKNLLKICELKQEVANNRVVKLQAQLKSAIKASSYNIRRKLLTMNLLAYQHDLLILPYYETRANYNGLLKAQKERIAFLENKVAEAKLTYNEALKNLEQISEEIHKMREETKKTYDNYNSNLEKNNINCHQLHQQQAHQNHEDRHNLNLSDQHQCSDSQNDFKDFTKPSSRQLNETCCDDEYLEFPSKLSIKSSPIHQRKLDEHDCPHLLRDFEKSSTLTVATIDEKLVLLKSNNKDPATSSSATSSTTNTANIDSINLTDEIEQWTEIRLSNSESTSSSGYSHQSVIIDDDRTTPSGSETPSSSDDNRKVTCTTVFNNTTSIHPNNDGGGFGIIKINDNGKNYSKKKSSGEGITTWITRSSSFRNSGRRQSLDILIDAGDRVKDVFTSSFQKVGRSLERRNSESEVNNDNSEFFLFSRTERDTLSDEQVENLLLNNEDEMKIMNDISK